MHRRRDVSAYLAVVGFWMFVLSTFVTADFCPTGCRCGRVENPRTYKMELTISCSNLSLTDVIKFQGWAKVDTLDLSSHAISVLKNHAFKGIIPKKILLAKNNISIIEPNAFVDVAEVTEELDLSSNSITQLPQGLDKMAALKTLKLVGNRKLRLQKGSFRGLTSLETLDLNQCYFDDIPDGTFDDVSGTLRKLILFFNELKAIPTALKILRNLEEVDFDSNPITHVPAHAFRGMNKLKKLTLSRHNFADPTSIHPLAFVDIASTLEDLDFYHSDLIEYPNEAISPLKKLKLLSFNSNNIREFPPSAFQALDSLKELTLDGNEFSFTREMFEGITDTLTMLSIRHMGLTELPLHELSVLENLEWLDASSNAFTTLPDNFTNGITPRRYTLNWMKINQISPTAFSGKGTPVHLSLSDNQISTLDFITDPCDFDYIDISDNPLICDCHAVLVAMHTYDVQMDGLCQQPAELANIELSSPAFGAAAERLCPNVTAPGVRACPGREYHFHPTSAATDVSRQFWLAFFITTTTTLLTFLSSVPSWHTLMQYFTINRIGYTSGDIHLSKSKFTLPK